MNPFSKSQTIPKEKIKTALAPIGGNILPFFRADVEGKREYGNLKNTTDSLLNLKQGYFLQSNDSLLTNRDCFLQNNNSLLINRDCFLQSNRDVVVKLGLSNYEFVPLTEIYLLTNL
jgi:hypothetical protein